MECPRFAALDMHGTAGTLPRRRFVTAEFIFVQAVRSEGGEGV
jgi:hypothetical protein